MRTNPPTRTVRTVTVRAEDLTDDMYVRFHNPRMSEDHHPWAWTYSVTRGGQPVADADDDTAKVAAAVDERYIVMRLSADKALKVPALRSNGVRTYRLDNFHPAAEYDDEIVIARSYDLYDVQVVTDSTETGALKL